jgi:TatD DNase family protein
VTVLIDTHIHLQDPRYTDDIQEVLGRASDQEIKAIIVPGTNFTDSLEAVHLAEQYADYPCSVFAAVGIHPTNAYELNHTSIQELRQLANHNRVIAIGEIGLDYYWLSRKNRQWRCADAEEQQLALELQLKLAQEMSLPVIIHNREAHEAIFRILGDWHRINPSTSGVLHSYSSGIKQLDAAIELGFSISIAGSVTYKNAHHLRQVAKSVPLDSLLLETDGPYLTPVPHRGKRNEPSYIHFIAEQIAIQREISFEQVANDTTRNAISLFQLNF